MKTVWRVLLSLALFIAYPLTAAFPFEGPLQVKNLYPIFFHAGQPYLEKAVMESSMSYSLSHSSTYTVQESGHWVINLDMEITELNFRYKRIIKNTAEFDLDIPVIIVGSGFMDGFLEDYHSAFGFPDYGRSGRPKNDLLYEVRRDGKLIIKGKNGVRLSDIRLALKKQLITLDGLALSVKGDLEVPVGDAETGFGNGSMDAGISILLDKKITDRIMTYWNLGAVLTGDVKGHNTLDLKDFIYGGGAVEADFGNGLSLIVQVLGQSSIYPETDLLAVDRGAVMLAVGGRYHKDRNTFDLSLTEDLSESGSPDFILNLTYQIKL